MARSRSKAAYRRKRKNRFSMFLVFLVVMFIMAAVSVKSIGLRAQLDAYTEQAAQLDQQIEAEKKRTEEIEEYRKYTQTKKYAEEVAKDKLGLVYEDEILFQQE